MAQNAKDIQLRELKDLLRELRETNKLLQKTLEETQKEKAVLRQERDNFKKQVDYLTKKFFGSSSEKGTCEIPGQMNLFNKAELTMCFSCWKRLGHFYCKRLIFDRHTGGVLTYK